MGLNPPEINVLAALGPLNLSQKATHHITELGCCGEQCGGSSMPVEFPCPVMLLGQSKGGKEVGKMQNGLQTSLEWEGGTGLEEAVSVAAVLPVSYKLFLASIHLPGGYDTWSCVSKIGGASS